MASTSIYRLRYPAPGDADNVPLWNGRLADDVEDELQRIDADATDLAGRVSTVENAGTPAWVKIDAGTATSPGDTFLISPIPSGTYSRVRLTLLGSVDTAGNIRIRLNADDTADLHHWSLLAHDANGNPDVTGSNNADTFWQVAHWGTSLTNTAIVEMFPTDVTDPVTYQSWGMRIGGSASTTVESRGWGRTNNPRLLDSLRVSGPPGTDFNGAVRWWLEGVLA